MSALPAGGYGGYGSNALLDQMAALQAAQDSGQTGWLDQVLARPVAADPHPAQEALPSTVTNFAFQAVPGGEYFYPLILVGPRGFSSPPPGFVFVGPGQEFLNATYYVLTKPGTSIGSLVSLQAGEHLARFDRPQDTVSPMSLSPGQLWTLSLDPRNTTPPGNDLWKQWSDLGQPHAWGAAYHHTSTNAWVDDVELGLEIAGAVLATAVTLGAGAPALAAAVSAIGAASIADPSSLTAVANDIEHAAQQTIDEINRIPSNVALYVQDPRAFIQAAAANLAKGWGAPLILLFGPAIVPVLMAISSGADARTLGQFGEALGRQVSKGAAVGIASMALAVAGLPWQVIEALNPISIGFVGSVAVSDDAVIAAAKVAEYFEGVVPFFPLAIEELTIQAQQTEQARDELRLHLNALRAQIIANGGMWYTVAVDVCHLIVQIAEILSGVGSIATFVEAALTIAGVTLQMVNAHQTMIVVQQKQRQQQAIDQAAAQAALDALNKQIADIEAEIARLAGSATAPGAVATTSTGSILAGKALPALALALLAAILMSSRRRP